MKPHLTPEAVFAVLAQHRISFTFLADDRQREEKKPYWRIFVDLDTPLNPRQTQALSQANFGFERGFSYRGTWGAS